MIVGAGTGNDAAAALRNAPEAQIDAVEIDPVIARLGKTLHPERPYEDPDVNVIIDDARSFLQKSDEPYDLIVFGFLDSHRLFSHMSSVRMDNYVYTPRELRQVRERLTDDGVVAVTFTIHEKWIADRIFTVMTDAFGHPPLVYQGDANGWGTTFLIGRDPLTVPGGATVIDEATAATTEVLRRPQPDHVALLGDGGLSRPGALLGQCRAPHRRLAVPVHAVADDPAELPVRPGSDIPRVVAAGVADGAVDRHEASVQLELLRARRRLRPARDARSPRSRWCSDPRG